MMRTTDIQDALQNYFDSKPTTLSDGTIATYDVALRSLERYLGRVATIADFTNETLSKWVEWQRQRISAATLYKYAKLLRSFGRWCHKQGLLDEPVNFSAPCPAGKQTTPLPTRRGFKAPLTPKSTVLAFVNEEFLGKSQQYLYRFHNCVNHLESFLGRVPLLRDLESTTLQVFVDWISELPLRDATKKCLREHVMVIARRAAEMDVVSYPDVKHGRAPVESGDPTKLGVFRYFEEYYMPDRENQGDPLAKETVKMYRSALRAYEQYSRGISLCQMITRRKLEGFRKWLIARGGNEKGAGNRMFVVAQVAKHCCPGKLLPASDELAPAVDIERTLEHVLEEYYLPSNPQVTSNKTYYQYLRVFYSFGKFLGRTPTLDDLSDINVGKYMWHCRDRGLSVHTVNGYRAKLVSLWNYAAKRRMVEFFPTVKEMPAPKELPNAWPKKDLRCLIKACKMMPGTVAGIPSPQWWRALHFVSWDTGERTGALLQLRWDMINVENGQLAVPARFRKGGRKAELYQLRPRTLTTLQRIRDPDSEVLLPWEKSMSTFYNRYKRLLKLAGLPYERYKSCLQKMRRSFATHVEAAGGNATDALGHTERSTTVKSYLDPKLIQRQHANELLFGLEEGDDS